MPEKKRSVTRMKIRLTVEMKKKQKRKIEKQKI